MSDNQILNNGKSYSFIEHIGSGNIGRCFLVKDTEDGKKYVLKVSDEYKYNSEFAGPYNNHADFLLDYEAYDLLLYLNNLWFPFICKCYAKGIIPTSDITIPQLKTEHNEPLMYTLLEYIPGSHEEDIEQLNNFRSVLDLLSCVFSTLYVLNEHGLTSR